jgi:hypothetical protein
MRTTRYTHPNLPDLFTPVLIDCVDGTRLHLWTAARWYMSVESCGGIMRQTDTPNSSTRALWQSFQQSYLVGSTRGVGEGNEEFGLLMLFCSYFPSDDLGPPALLPFPRKACCGFVSPLKIHRLSRVWTREPCVQWQSRYPLRHRWRYIFTCIAYTFSINSVWNVTLTRRQKLLPPKKKNLFW